MNELRSNDHEPVSLGEAKRRIGFRRGWRSLLTALTARELVHGVRFVDRFVGPSRTRFRVTVAAIRAYAPDLIKGEAAKLTGHQAIEVRQFREALAELDERAAEIAVEQIYKRVKPECLCNVGQAANRRNY
jgi:hypothetical protein